MKETIRMNLDDLMVRSATKNTELANEIGVSKAAVSNWRNGTNSIDIDLLPKISEFFNVPIERLLSNPDVKTDYYVAKFQDEDLERYFERSKELLSAKVDDEIIHELVSLFTRMDDDDRTSFLSMARTLAFAGDQKKEDARRAASGDREAVTDERGGHHA